MNRDQIKGKGRQVMGRINDAAGSLVGDTSREIKGKAQQIGGKIQEGYGNLKEHGRRAMAQERQYQREERGFDRNL